MSSNEPRPALSGDRHVTPPPVSRWVAIGCGVTLAFFTLTVALSYQNQQRFIASEDLAASSRLLIVEVGELVSLLQSAETAQRGYLFTDDKVFLEPYALSVQEVPEKLDDLDELASSAEHMSAIVGIRKAAEARLIHLNRTLEILDANGRQAAKAEIVSGRGQDLMQSLRDQATVFQRGETKALSERRVAAAKVLRFTHLSDLFAALIGLGLAGMAFVRLRREFLARYAAARDLDEQRELLQVTLHSIGDAVATIDREGRVRSLNAAAERLVSWPVAEAAGRPLAEVFRLVNEQTRATVENPALRALRDEQGTRQANHTLLIGRDGTERRIDGSAAPIRTSDGRVLGAVLTFRDVTERKRSEDALRRSEERLRRALRASRMVAWEIDVRADVVIRSENVTDLLGLPPFGPAAEYLELVHPQDRPAADAALGRALRGEGDYAAEFRAVLPDGRTLWIADKGEVRRDEQGEPTHVVGVLMDVTDLKRAEEDLREADRRKDQFLATLAHELRNPLAPVSNALEAWPFVKDDPAELERLRETMARQVAQMMRLIDDLLDMSRITRGKIALRKERTDLGRLLEAAVEGVRPLLDARRHALRLSIPDPPPMLDGDVARLVQVFTNLIHNAAKYTDEGGRIEVAARVEPGEPPGLSRRDGAAGARDACNGSPRAVVSVTDNGPGISGPMLSGIFDMFTQVDQTLDRAHGGLGIGLTLVKTLVELHGGTVEARSAGPGTGSTFLVSLPLATGDDESRPTAPAGRAGDATDGRRLPSLRVLIVDDMRPSARTLAMMLKGIGQETRVAHDGASGLAALDAFAPDVVLLDIAMPGMDGYEVARRIRQRPRRQPLLVALTGYGQEEDRRRAFEAGFDKHLVKPTSLDALKALLMEAEPAATQPADAS